MNPIVIHCSRSQVQTLLRGAIAFIIIGATMILLPDTDIGRIGTIVGWSSVSFFGAVAVYALIRLNSNKPALIIDSKGITDNASGLSAGFIPWSDITGSGIVTFLEQKFIGIALKDPQKYLAKVNPIKRLLMRMNSSMAGYVVCIPQVTFSIPIEEVLAHIEARYAQFAKNKF